MWRKFLIVVLILFSREGASKRLFNIENLQNSSYLQLFSLYQAKQVEQQEKHEPSQQHQDINDKNQLLEFEYVSNLLQQKDYLMKEYRSLHVPQVSPIMSVTNDQTTYSTIYQDYILTKKSFKGKLKSEATKSGSNSAASVSISLSDCVQQDQKMELDAITNDYSLKNCNSMELNKIIPIPNIAYNSYTVRFKQNEELMEDLILNLTDHWPTILPLDDNELRPIETCPLNMHMILWGASDDVIARVFNTEVASSSFSPKFGKSVAHYFEYSRNGYSHSSLPPYAETIIQPGEYLFIPNNQLVSLQTKGEPDGEKKEKSLLKLCFFDASNVNDVRNSLKIESYISRSSADFLKQLNSPSSFDFTMIREPPADIVVDQYLVFPKPVVSTESKRTEHQELSGNRRYRGKSDYKG